jgi:uncharacterized protein (TIRG00374 family)
MKKYKRLFLILALSLLMIWALIKLGNVDLSLTSWRRVHWGWYSLVILSYYASIVARGWRWQRILQTMGWPVSFIYATTLLTTGLFLSAILPARAGDVGRVAMLRQDHRIPVAQGIASIAGERVLDVFAILTLALLGAWLALSGRMPPEVLQLIVGGGALLVIGLVGLLVVPGIEIWLREPPLLPNILPAKLWTLYQKILDFGFSLIEGVRILGRRPGVLAFIVGQSFFIWLWDALMVYFILISLGIVAPFSVSLFAAMISDLVTAIPLTPGALGQFDAALIGLLALFGISTANAGLTVLLLRLVQLWTFIPVSGLVTYIFGFSRVLHLGQAETRPDHLELSSSTAGQS